MLVLPLLLPLRLPLPPLVCDGGCGDGVPASMSSMHRGDAISDDDDAGDGVYGYHVKIDELSGAEGGGAAALGEGRGGDTAAVEKNKGGVGTEATKGNGGGAGGGSVHAVFAQTAGADLGNFPQKRVKTTRASLLDLGVGEDAEVDPTARLASA